MPKWKCKNWSEETAIEHDLKPCDCISGCGGKLCDACCEEEMFGSEEDE